MLWSASSSILTEGIAVSLGAGKAFDCISVDLAFSASPDAGVKATLLFDCLASRDALRSAKEEGMKRWGCKAM